MLLARVVEVRWIQRVSALVVGVGGQVLLHGLGPRIPALLRAP